MGCFLTTPDKEVTIRKTRSSGRVKGDEESKESNKSEKDLTKDQAKIEKGLLSPNDLSEL
jgi:hypothetical protein